MEIARTWSLMAVPDTAVRRKNFTVIQIVAVATMETVHRLEAALYNEVHEFCYFAFFIDIIPIL